MFTNIIYIFLIITFYYFLISKIINIKLSYNIINFYFLFSFFYFLFFFCMNINKYDFIYFFYHFLFFLDFIIVIAPYLIALFFNIYIKWYTQKNFNYSILASCLKLLFLFIIIFISKSFFLFFFFLLEGRKLYSYFRSIKSVDLSNSKCNCDKDIVIAKESFFKYLYFNLKPQSSASFWLFFGIYVVGATVTPVAFAYDAVNNYDAASCTPLTEKNWSRIILYQNVWIFSWIALCLCYLLI